MTLAKGAQKTPATNQPDWPAILAPGGRWSALVRTGAGPVDVPRQGLAFLAAPYLAEILAGTGKWTAWRSDLMSVAIGRELERLRRAGISAVCPVAMQAWMMTAGLLTGSEVNPLSPPGPAPADPAPADWADWARPFLLAAARIIVPDVQGWDRCPVVLDQVRCGLERNLPVVIYGRIR